MCRIPGHKAMGRDSERIDNVLLACRKQFLYPGYIYEPGAMIILPPMIFL